MAKWYEHRSAQVVRRLKVAESLLSDDDVNVAELAPPIRRSRLRTDKEKLIAIANTPITHRGRKSEPSKIQHYF